MCVSVFDTGVKKKVNRFQVCPGNAESERACSQIGIFPNSNFLSKSIIY
jgi:hypothetical protein